MHQAKVLSSLPPPALPPAGYLALLTEAIDAGVLILGADRTIVHCNDALGAIFGLSRRAILEMGYEGLLDRIRTATVSPLGGLGQHHSGVGGPCLLVQEKLTAQRGLAAFLADVSIGGILLVLVVVELFPVLHASVHTRARVFTRLERVDAPSGTFYD